MAMKKICLLLIVLVLFLTSCGNMEILNQDDSMIANNTFERIINKIKTQDSRGLKSLFSKAVQDTTSDLEENCVNLIQFIQGDIVSISDAEDAGIGAYCEIETGASPKVFAHEEDFLPYVHGKNAEFTLHTAVKAMAMTALEVLHDPKIVKEKAI